MKLTFLILLALLVVAPSAAAGGEEVKKVSVRGEIRSLENKATTWMYGNYVLLSDNEVLYALESGGVDLENYEGETTLVEGKLVHEGVDGGPPLLQVGSVGVSDEPYVDIGRDNTFTVDTGGDFYVAKTNSISVEAALNKPSVTYDFDALENVENVKKVSSGRYLYRSRRFDNLAVILYRTDMVPTGEEQEGCISLRLTPVYRTTKDVVGYSTEIRFQEAPSRDNLRKLGWRVAGSADTFKAIYHGNQEFRLAIGARENEEGFVDIDFKTEKVDEDLKEKASNYLEKILKLEESEIKKELAQLNKKTRTRLDPVFNFTDEKAKQALRTELRWLENVGITGGLTQTDIDSITQVSEIGMAGPNLRIVHENGEWLPYQKTDYVKFRESTGETSENVEVTLPSGSAGFEIMKNDRTENLSPEISPVSRDLDPEEVETEISEDEAVKIVENLGYEPNSPSITLSEANNWNKRYWTLSWKEDENSVTIEIDADTGEVLILYDTSPGGPLDLKPETVENLLREGDEEATRSVLREKIREITSFPKNAVPTELDVRQAFNREEGPKVLYAEWREEIEGIKVEQTASIAVRIVVSSGHLLSFRNVWFGENEIVKEQPEVSEEKCIEKAKKAAEFMDLPDLLAYRFENANKIETSLAYKRPHYPLNENLPLYGDKVRLIRTVSFKSDKGNVSFYIGACSGEYLGMTYTMGSEPGENSKGLLPIVSIMASLAVLVVVLAIVLYRRKETDGTG